MGEIGYLNHDGQRWRLSVGGKESTFDDYEEALQQARAALIKSGGTIYVGAGPGARPGPVRVARLDIGPVASNLSLDRLTLRPPSSPAATTPTKSSEPKEALAIDSEIAALRTAYQRAHLQIEGLGDTTEQDVGLGTLRLEAAQTLQRLRVAGVGLSEADLQPLSTYVSSLSGGKTAERAVQSFEMAAKKVLRDIFSSLLYVTAKGSVALIAGIIAFYFGYSAKLGAEVAGVFVAGGSVMLFGAFRMLTRAAPTVGRVSEGAWDWACNLGIASELALAEPRELEQQLWRRCGGAGSLRHRSLAIRARLAAQTIVAVSFLFIAIGVCGFIGGFIGFFEALGNGAPSGVSEEPFP